MNKLAIGPAGWSYEDWKGWVYPTGAGRRFDPLPYLAERFDVIEINSSFYHPPPRKYARAWARRVEPFPRFRFTAKLWRRFTHERGTAPDRADVAQAREALDALAEEDRLRAVLVQFPWSFRNDAPSRAWVASVVEAFDAYPLALEVRHASWDDPPFLDWLKEREIALVAIDQPPHEGSLGLVVWRTGPLAFFRFHGRNHAAWFARQRPSHERYDYLYDADELAPWVERMTEAVDDPSVEAVVAITNNHFRGQAVVNALQLMSMAGGEPLRAPACLAGHYPEVFGGSIAGPAQADLFGTGSETEGSKR